MRIAIPKENHPGENRVPITPESAKKLCRMGAELVVEGRGVVADGKERQLKVLVPMRGTHLVQPTVSEIRLGVDPSSKTSKPRKTKAGVFNVRRVIASAGDGEIAWFDVEADAPHRLIAFTAGGVSGELKHFEKRPYWDRSNASSYHAVGAAP